MRTGSRVIIHAPEPPVWLQVPRSIKDWGLLDRIIVASPLTARRRSSYLKDSDFVRYVELSVLDHSCDIAFVSVFGPATGERLGVRVILKANRRLVRDILIPT